MWEVQIRFVDGWTTLKAGYKTRDDAEWAIGMWKQENNCTGDRDFRTVQTVAKCDGNG